MRKGQKGTNNGTLSTKPTTDSSSNCGSNPAIQQTRTTKQQQQQGGSNGIRWGQRSSSSNASGGEVEAAAMVHPIVTRYGEGYELTDFF